MPIRRSIEALKRDMASARVKGSFARNALYTMGDAMVNVGVQLVLTPIVAGIYGPVAYGVYALFNGLSGLLATLGCFGFQAAFVLPKAEPEFRTLFRLTATLLLATVVISLPVFLQPSLLYSWIPSWSVMGRWCMLIPWMALVLGGSQMMAAWNMRVKAFGTNAKINSATNLGVRLANLGVGLLTKGAVWGLMLGDTLVRSATALWYAASLRGQGLTRPFRDEHAPTRSVLREYKEYPLFVFPSTWLVLFSLQLPIFGLSELGNTRASGCFSLASALLLLPLRLFGYSLSSVFIRKATDLRHEAQAMGQLVRKMYLRLRLLGLLPFCALIFFGDLVFDLILGEEWALAGAYAGVMGPFYLFRLLSEPIASVYNAKREEKAIFRFSVGLFVLNLVAVGVGIRVLADPRATILLFSAVNALAYLFQSTDILRRTGLAHWRMTALTLTALVLVCAVLAVLRYLLTGTWHASLI